MGSAMLCGVTGIAPVIIENSAAYLRSWISVLKGDSKLIVTAASAAQKACDYIRGPQADEVADVETQQQAIAA
jgi:antirestriction protein ArdC